MIIMDDKELSALHHMQNETQRLLEKLQMNQSYCRQLLNTSLHNISGISSNSQIKTGSKSSLSHTQEATQEKKNQQCPTPTSRIQKQKILSDLQAARSKMGNYKKVSSGDVPGKPHGPKLQQGIENNRFLFGDQSLRNNHVAANFTSFNGEHDDYANDSYEYSSDKELSDTERANTSVTFQDELELLGSGSANVSGTPRKSNKTLSGTPRSILKHRKIIDDNVRVESEYQHTPVNLLTPRAKHGLNYSYSSIDDSTINSSRSDKWKQDDISNGSYIEECLKERSPVNVKVHKATSSGSQNKMLSSIDRLVKERLLLDEGNDRKNASLVRDLSKRPKSYIFQPADDLEVSHVEQSNTNKKKTPIKAATPKSPRLKSSNKSSQGTPASRIPDASAASKLWRSRDKPLLGYDWIASNLENDNSLFDQPDEYFREIQEFRNKHKQFCSGRTFQGRNLDLSRPISPEVTDPGHKCLHGYTLNERLFTEPMNANDEGKSVCPVCLTSREEPSEESPGFVRVSIPRSTLDKPYKIKAHRRRSFDCTDSYALSQHCLAGYECSLPTTIPTAKNIDIRGANGIQGKQAMTLKEAEDFAKSHSRKSRLMATQPSKMSLPLASDYNRTGSSVISGLNLASDSLSRRPEKSSRSATGAWTTDSLLNVTHNLRYDLQDLARRTGRDKHKIPHSTNYPVL